MDSKTADFLNAVTNALPGAVLQGEGVQGQVRNIIGLPACIEVIVCPESTQETSVALSLAHEHRVQVALRSLGMNAGYGMNSPASNAQVLLSLERMKRISHYQRRLGRITIEAGVSQGEWARYLMDEGDMHRPDVTGAGPDVSVLGRLHQFGMGHTPLGNPRDLIHALTVVLANGEIEHTGKFLSPHIDTRDIHLRGTNSVVTEATLNLNPTPHHFEYFIVVGEKEEDLGGIVETISKLRQADVIKNVVHTANPTRLLTSMLPRSQIEKKIIPPDYAAAEVYSMLPQSLFPDFMQRLPGRFFTNTFFNSVYWTAFGGLYGEEPGDVEGDKDRIRREFEAIGCPVHFFTDARIDNIRAGVLRQPKEARAYQGRFGKRGASYNGMLGLVQAVGGMMQGKPVDIQLRSMLENPNVGLVWLSPAFPAEKKAAHEVYRLLLEGTRQTHDAAITVNSVTAREMVGVTSLSFDNSDPESIALAHRVYYELSEAFETAGFGPYRHGSLDKTRHRPNSADQRIKKAYDPQHIIVSG